MRKIILTVLCFLFMASFFVAPVKASETTYSRAKAGWCRISSDSTVSHAVNFYSTQSNLAEYKESYFLFKVPVSAVASSDCLVIDSRKLGSFQASFFWSSHDLTSNTFWSTSYSNGFAHKSLSYNYGSSYFVPLKGTITTSSNGLMAEYGADINVFELPDTFSKTSGYLYISGYTSGAWDCSMMEVVVLPLSDVDSTFPEPIPEPTPEPTPEPIPTPSPSPVVPSIGSVSAELGTFGTDDGTQNGVYTAFEKLYNSLIDIVSDDSVPDMSILDSVESVGAVPAVYSGQSRLSASAYSLSDDSAVSSRAVSSGSSITYKALLDKWRASENETIYPDDASWSISPYSVEIAETSPTRGEGYRDGNSYVLNYRLRIPIRFIYSGHTGTALSNPQFSFNLDIAYSGDTTTVQYGEPSFYIDTDDISYDRMLDLVTSSGGMSGDVSVALFNVPVIDAYSQYSYDLILEFPLYITEVNSPLVLPNAVQYESTVTLNSFTYNQEIEFIHLSDTTTDQTLQDIANEQKNQNDLENERYEQEQDTINQATDSVDSGVAEITDTLSSWEIFTLPITVMKDFIDAITSSSEAKFTFPSFELMGQTLWPSYTFDLNLISGKFPLLCNSVHLISGILIVIWFLHYLWRKWSLITGDDLPEEG